jgi:hypothetical protein
VCGGGGDRGAWLDWGTNISSFEAEERISRQKHILINVWWLLGTGQSGEYGGSFVHMASAHGSIKLSPAVLT